MGLGKPNSSNDENLGKSLTLYKSHLVLTANGQMILKFLSMLPLCDLENNWNCSEVNQQMFTSTKHVPDTIPALTELTYKLQNLQNPESGNYLATWKNAVFRKSCQLLNHHAFLESKLSKSEQLSQSLSKEGPLAAHVHPANDMECRRERKKLVSVLLELRVWWAEGGMERDSWKPIKVPCNRHTGFVETDLRARWGGIQDIAVCYMER